MTEQEQFALLESVSDNTTVFDAYEKAFAVLGDDRARTVCASISGGADSDIVLDMCTRIRKDIEYVWFNTGLEYQATKDHLKYLEKKYGIKIHRVRAVVPVPKAVREYGYPFIGKTEAEHIGRLQRHGFDFVDGSFEELYRKYPRCKAALKWWCNEWGEGSRFNISRWKYLKEFMIENPPTFPISNKCCQGAKKDTAHKYVSENGIDLTLIGTRKAEGGARAAKNTCFTENKGSGAIFRPIFWFKDSDKEWYERNFDVRHSACYWQYSLGRTGCVACPFGKNWEHELEVAKQYEPKLYKACKNVFAPSYEYTRAYWKFRKHKEAEAKGYEQLSLFD